MSSEPARAKAVGIASAGRVRSLEEAGLRVVWDEDWKRTRSELRRLAALVDGMRAKGDDDHTQRAALKMAARDAWRVLEGGD